MFSRGNVEIKASAARRPGVPMVAARADRLDPAGARVAPLRPMGCACGGGCARCVAAALQRKASVGGSGERQEREADAFADRAAQRGNAAAQAGSGARTEAAAPLDTGTAMDAARRGGEPLSAGLRGAFEPVLGVDLSPVRVHTGAAAERGARAVQARAYTVGDDIVFAQGEYQPQSAGGRWLLAHELAHVAQQAAGAATAAPLQRKDGADAAVPEVMSVAGAVAALQRAKALDVDDGDHAAALAIVTRVRIYLDATITDAAMRETFKGMVAPILAAGSASNVDFVIRMALGGVHSLESKLRAGQNGSSGTWNYHLTEVLAGEQLMQQVERNPKARPQKKADPNALIPIADFIAYVEAVEVGYPKDTAADIVTRIRQLYYQGSAFERLIPGARSKDGNLTRMTSEDRIGADAQRHLAARADENATQDNPSPYIVLANGSQTDVGHLLLGLDALIHTAAPADPYKSFGVPAIDPASWVADLGIAAVWMEQHEKGQQPESPRKLASPDLAAYYQMSAPDQDLLGDIDSFALGKVFTIRPNWPLSKMMRGYYLGLGSHAAVDRRTRYVTFCMANQLTFTQSGSDIAWSFDRAAVIARIDRFNDLFGAGAFGAALATVFGTPKPAQWKYSGAVLDRFLDWLKPRLVAELAINAAAAAIP